MDRRMDGWILNRWTDGDGQTDRQTEKWLYGQTDRNKVVQIKGQMDRHTDEWADKQIDCIKQSSLPLKYLNCTQVIIAMGLSVKCLITCPCIEM
jgi:hypothetical protein